MFRSKNSALEGIRGAGALAVCLFHLWLYARPDPPAAIAHGMLAQLWSVQRWWLLCFFILSGFLLCRPWIRAALRSDARPDVRSYFRHRALRILPAYYLALAAAAILLAGADQVPGVRMPVGESWALFAVFGQNFSSGSVLTLDPPMWTLSVEACFYLVLPLIGWAMLRIGRHRGRQALLLLVLFTLGELWNQLTAGSAEPFTKVLPALLPYFALGMAGALWLEGRRPRQSTLAVLLALAVGGWTANFVLTQVDPAWFAAFNNMPVAIGFTALICLAWAAPAHVSIKPLASRPAAWFGSISYGFFLWHMIVIWWLRSRGLLPLDILPAAMVVVPLSTGIAWCSWRFVERPILEWSSRALRTPAAAAA